MYDAMATIVKRGSSYRIMVPNGYDIYGKKIMETTTFKPDKDMTEKQIKKAVEKFAFEFEDRVKNGKLLKGNKMTFHEYSNKWLTEYASNNLAMTTIEGYKTFINQILLPAFGHLKLTEISPLHLQMFYNNLLEDGVRSDNQKGGYSKGSIKKISAILSSMLNTAVQWQLIENNPCQKVKTPKTPKIKESIKFFTLEQTEEFLLALDMPIISVHSEHDRVDDTGKKYHVPTYTEKRTLPLQFKSFFYVALFGGLRRGEILALTWDDIDLENGILTINKSAAVVNNQIINKSTKNDSSNRTIQLPNVVTNLLKEQKKEQNVYRLSIGDQWIGENHIFIQWNGKQMHPSTPYHTFKKVINNYNSTVEDVKDKLPSITLHGLRHTSATLLISNNVNVRTVSARLGHAQTSTTMNIYAHALESLDIQAANILDDVFSNSNSAAKKSIVTN